jgi:hypothetical protein
MEKSPFENENAETYLIIAKYFKNCYENQEKFDEILYLEKGLKSDFFRDVF